MPLPSVDEFIGPNVTQQGFKDAQKNMLEYISDELPTKTDLETEVSAVELKIQPKADKTYVDTALASFQNGAIKTYPTLAAANADIANIALNTKISVLSVEGGGDYYKASASATSLTKSPYDPLSLAKTDASTKAEAAEVNAKTAISNRIDFVFGIAENNQFIKEMYITGWDGSTDLYLRIFNGNDSGKVTFTIFNASGAMVAYTYQKAQNLQIYPIETAGEAAGSGLGGYVVIDWNLYTTAINSSTNTFKINKRARNLVNCPFIKEYLDKISTDAAIASNTAAIAVNSNDIVAIKKNGIFQKTLDSTATHAQKDLINNLVPNIKLIKGYATGFSYHISQIALITGGIRVQLQYYDPANPSATNTWASYNIDILQGSNLVESYEVKYQKYIWLVTIDWNYISQLTANIAGSRATTLLNTQRLFDKDEIYLARSQAGFYKIGNSIKDGQSKNAALFSDFTFSANVDENYAYTLEKVSNGTRIVYSNTNAGVNRRFRFAKAPTYHRLPETYFVFIDFTVNAYTGTRSTLTAGFSKAGKAVTTETFLDNIRAGKRYSEVRKITGDVTGEYAMDATMYFDFWSSNDSAAGVQLDITIHDFRVLYNYAQDSVFLNKTRKEVEALVNALGYFESEVSIPLVVDTALVHQDINTKLDMQSLGDSTSAMVMWQERLAQIKGWNFDRSLALTGKNGGYAVALGGSWLEPVIANTNSPQGAGHNQYIRSQSIKDYGIDVLFILSSYNGVQAGKNWSAINSALSTSQNAPADHGINDAPYTGGEVNLLTNPTAVYPSFGASYYGMLERLMTENPTTRIVLLTLYLFKQANKAEVRLKNAVIRKAAETYNLQLIDLEKISGINDITSLTLCFDNGGVHINQQGGDRLAQVISGLI